MERRLVAVGKQAGAFEDDGDAERFPRELAGIAFAEYGDVRAVDKQCLAIGAHGALERSVNRIVSQQVRERFGIGDVVDSDEFQVAVVRGQSRAVDVTVDWDGAVDGWIVVYF